MLLIKFQFLLLFLIVQSAFGVSLPNHTHSSIKKKIVKRSVSERKSELDNDNRFNQYDKLLNNQSKTRIRNEQLVMKDISEDKEKNTMEIDNPIHKERIGTKHEVKESIKKKNQNDLNEEKSPSQSFSVGKRTPKYNNSIENYSNPLSMESLLRHPQLRYMKLQYSLQNMKQSSKSVSFCLNHNFPGNSYCHVMSQHGNILSTVTVNHDSEGSSTNCKQVHISLSSLSHRMKSKTPAYIQCETMNPFEKEERMITPSLELSKSQSSGNSFRTILIRILLIMIIILIIGVFVQIAVIKSTQADDDLFDLDAVESASLLSKQYEQSSFLPRGALSPDRFASLTSAVSEFSGIESLMSRKSIRSHRKKEGKTRNKPRLGSPRIEGTTCPSCGFVNATSSVVCRNCSMVLV